MLDIAAACLVITALLAYLNRRFARLPTVVFSILVQGLSIGKVIRRAMVSASGRS